MFAVLIKLYPYRDNEEGKLTIAGPWETEAEAQHYIDQARRANLPHKGQWIINFEDPRAQG